MFRHLHVSRGDNIVSACGGKEEGHDEKIHGMMTGPSFVGRMDRRNQPQSITISCAAISHFSTMTLDKFQRILPSLA